MGQRANLIIVKKDSYDLYYSHWCANTLPRDIFWGPEHAINFIQLQVKKDIDDWWLDDIWAEGGVIVDIEKKILLMYGGENILFDIPLR
ncbi:MAG: hypothetical protein H7Y18_01450 [Clostridiaceae bacterium]|nr:hypothetical protein [Clostridiaceae bacterium]